jgi:hypothetical protein
MADFAEWAVACETAYWEPGTFMRVFGANEVAATHQVVENDLVAAAIIELMGQTSIWRGTMSDLLARLRGVVGPETARSLPKAPHTLRQHIDRIDDDLRGIGIEFELGIREGKWRKRFVVIRADSQAEEAESDE